MDDQLYRDPAFAALYDFDNGWSEDRTFCLKNAPETASVLDLGCGTGALAVALSKGRRVTAVDPAAAMLDVARARPGGGQVAWVEADARTVRLGERFDLVVMTGHAFQVFLTGDDRRAVCGTIAAHLAAGGQFVFDSRNPDVAEWRDWTPERSRRTFDHPVHGRVEAWNDVVFDSATSVATYDTFCRLPATGEILSGRSRIAFPSQAEIAANLADAGLAVDRWRGDWQGSDFKPGAPELIAIGGRAA